MPLQISLEWQEHLSALADFRGMLMVVGAPDSGKTFFCAALLNTWVEAGRRTAVIDCDLGQSEIGPPGAVGLAYATEATEGLSALEPAGIEFVGATSPQCNAALALTAIRLLADRVAGAEALLIDTCGHVFGPSARLYKTAKVRLLRPGLIAALQHGTEMEPLLRLFERLNGPRVVRVPASPHVVRRSPHVRARRREAKWARYFRDAAERVVRLDEVEIVGARWRSGERLTSEELHQVAALTRGEPLWAERAPGSLTVVMRGRLQEDGLYALQDQFGVRHVNMIHPARFRGVLCGVADPDGRTIALGILLGVDFAREEVRLLTPLRSVRSIRTLHFGMHRVAPDGRDLGPTRPWEV